MAGAAPAVTPVGRTLAVAHRGDPYRVRENTLASLRSAVAAGADAVEYDVRLTRDGVPVLLHDVTLKRLWGYDMPVAALDYAEVARRTGGGVPTLRAALKVMAEEPSVRSFIDLPAPDAATATVAEVQASGAAASVYYCGATAALLAVREADDTAEIALSGKNGARHTASLLTALRPRWLNYRWGYVTPYIVRRDHEDGYLVSCWTVDWDRNIRSLRDLGVDSITSNRITGLRKILDG
ncbi:glycerophosphodiester phosphodiesterase [Streptomyces sp. A7024]|uniref:Glycerophosphodiester phosphodiesterase n=1 Tax=Streptomyces coryli TaxID=1128680 RepID=A0A6G4TZC0_9ACTN|nr:glycerophosphodiester phosphodiesterase [Streptomyces coryli]NGN64870.1 glycerophosphodiester phosphodiesterase [Streptomyces coryli]